MRRAREARGRSEAEEAIGRARPTAKRSLTERLKHAAALGAALIGGGRHPTRGADALGAAAATLLVARDPGEFAEDIPDRAQIHLDLLRRSSTDLGGALSSHSVEAAGQQQANGAESTVISERAFSRCAGVQRRGLGDCCGARAGLIVAVLG